MTNELMKIREAARAAKIGPTGAMTMVVDAFEEGAIWLYEHPIYGVRSLRHAYEQLENHRAELQNKLVDALKAIDPSQPTLTKYIKEQVLAAFEKEMEEAK